MGQRRDQAVQEAVNSTFIIVGSQIAVVVDLGFLLLGLWD